MYFPGGFDLERSIELGELVEQAYAQLESFRKGQEWQLKGDTTLVKELHYLKQSGRSLIRGSGFFDLDVQGLHFVAGEARDIPIGFIARRGRDVFIIFRGTITDLEWFRNFSISLVPYPLPDFGKVHDGFLETYHLFHRTINETLDSLGPGMRIFIAGHSLGGALATIALPDIGMRMDPDCVALYTYGSPRLGDNAFVTAFNRRYAGRSFRIANTSDMVGLVPPPSPLVGPIGGYFSHVDTGVSFTVQNEDMVLNHDIRTYLEVLRQEREQHAPLNRLRTWLDGLHLHPPRWVHRA